MKNIWKELKKPIFILAPMEDVTDTVFRQIIAHCAPPDLFFTEFTSIDGLLSKGAENVKRRFLYTEKERPLIAQIWGSSPQKFYEAASLISTMGFDGIDINMGCPDRGVMKHGGGSALIGKKDQVKDIVDSVKNATNLPLSIKTRIGIKDIVTEDWISFLLSLNLDALTVHGRTARDMSKVPALWDEIGKAAKLKNSIAPETILIGNGDVLTRKDGLEKVDKYKVDGIMIGRGIFNNLWTFEKVEQEHTLNDNILALLKHVELFESTWGDRKNFLILKKFFKAYIKDFQNASDLRGKLMETKNGEEVKKILTEFIN